MREGPAREEREHAERDDVDAGRRGARAARRPAAGHPREHAGAPGREERRATTMKAVSLRVRVREALRRARAARSAGGEATRRAVPPRRRRPGTGAGRSAAAPAYSIRPRRIALATAAARSETPSFSYRCWTCVFTVVSPRKSSFAISGRLLPAAIRWRISCSRWVSAGVSSCFRSRISETRPGGDVRRDDVLAAGAGEHRVDDLLAAGLLGDEAGGAGLERLVDDAAVGEGGDEQHARRAAGRGRRRA